MKLLSARIQNLQSHKDTKIDFHPGVNVIVGNTDVGKSALLRGIYWALFNKPNKDIFTSHWGGSTEVLLNFEDGQLERIKNKQFNSYVLGSAEYTGFGFHPPEPVVDFVNMDIVNFQAQLDPPFMFSWSPGERGIFINKIADIEIIDRTVDNIKKTIRTEKRTIENLETNIKENKEEIKTFDFIDDLENDVNGLEKNFLRMDNLENTYEDLSDLIIDIENIEEKSKKLDSILPAEKEINKLIEYYEQLKILEKEYNDLYYLIQDIEECKEDIKINLKNITLFEEKFNKLMPEQCPLCGK